MNIAQHTVFLLSFKWIEQNKNKNKWWPVNGGKQEDKLILSGKQEKQKLTILILFLPWWMYLITGWDAWNLIQSFMLIQGFFNCITHDPWGYSGIHDPWSKGSLMKDSGI